MRQYKGMENLFITKSDYIKNIFTAAWKDFKKYWKIIIIIQLGFLALRLLSSALTAGGERSIFDIIVTIVFSLGITFFSLGFITIVLKITKGKEPKVSDLWENVGFKKFATFIIANILVLMAVVGGVMFLIIPGIIMSLGLIFSVFGILDQEKGIWDSLMHSLRITKGYRWRLFMLPLVFVFIGLVAYGLVLTAISFSPTLFWIYLSTALLVLTIVATVVFYPLVMARAYNELQAVHEQNETEPNVKTEKVFGIIFAVIAPFGLFALVSVLMVLNQRAIESEQIQQQIEETQMQGKLDKEVMVSENEQAQSTDQVIDIGIESIDGY